MSTFEPRVVMSILKSSAILLANQRSEFEGKWKASVSFFLLASIGIRFDVHMWQVDARVKAWIKHRNTSQSSFTPQLEWEANVVEYVNFVYKLTKCHGNSKKDALPLSLPKDIPLFGPQFLPPSYLHVQRRRPAPVIQPETAYLKPFNVIHPFYYDNLSKCPQCESTDVRWDGWTTTGHWDLHGVREEETALGYQLVCKPCEGHFSHAKGSAGNDEGSFCFATTNMVFWKKWEHWEIPRLCFV